MRTKGFSMCRFERAGLGLSLCLLVGASQAVALHYRPEDWVTYTDFRYIHSVAADLRFVYLGTDGGIARLNRITRRWDHPLTTGDGVPEIPVRVVAPDPSTRSLWVLTGTSLNRYDPALEQWKGFSSLGSTPASLVETIGVGSEFIYARAGSTILRMDRVKEVWEASPSPPDEVRWYGGEQDLKKYPFLAPYYVLDDRFRRYGMTSLDKDGFDIWVGTSGYGLLYYNSQTLASEHHFFGLAGQSVKALDKDGETLWIGGDSDGITCWNQDKDIWDYYDDQLNYGLLSPRVADITSDSLWIWFGTGEGLARYDRAKGRWKTFTVFDGLCTNAVTAVEVDEDVLWIGTEEGLCRMDKEDSKISRIDAFKYLRINDLVKGPSYVWVATSKGVFVFDRREEIWGSFGSPDKSLELGTNSILLNEEKVWFGTEYKGVACYDREEGNWQSYLAPVYLPTNEVLCLGADKENVWVGTASGASRFNRGRRSWTNYSTADGLIANRIDTILPDGDYVYFGTPKGLTSFWWNDPFLPK